MSPTERTLDLCRKLGWPVDIGERFIPGGKFGRRKDLFGFIDLVALPPGVGSLGIQATSAGEVSRRLRKIEGEQQPEETADQAASRLRNVIEWLHRGNSIEVWGWGKRARPVNRKWYYLRRVAVELHGSTIRRIEL